jgi:hypothetical protein
LNAVKLFHFALMIEGGKFVQDVGLQSEIERAQISDCGGHCEPFAVSMDTVGGDERGG